MCVVNFLGILRNSCGLGNDHLSDGLSTSATHFGNFWRTKYQFNNQVSTFFLRFNLNSASEPYQQESLASV